MPREWLEVDYSEIIKMAAELPNKTLTKFIRPAVRTAANDAKKVTADLAPKASGAMQSAFGVSVTQLKGGIGLEGKVKIKPEVWNNRTTAVYRYFWPQNSGWTTRSGRKI